MNEDKQQDWEIYEDHGYYGLWAVRYIKDKSFNSPRLFHFKSKSDALEFQKLLTKSYYAEGKDD